MLIRQGFIYLYLFYYFTSAYISATVVKLEPRWYLVWHNTHTKSFYCSWNLSRTTQVSGYQKGKNQEGKTNLDLLEQEIVSGSGICWQYASLHLIITDNHTNIPQLSFLQAGCPSCRQTNSVKALNEDILCYYPEEKQYSLVCISYQV